MIREFAQVGMYAAFSEAQRFLTARHLTVGPIKAGKSTDPAGIVLDYVKLPIWSAMTHAQRASLDGQIRPAPGRHLIEGPVVVEIRDDRPRAIAAFCRPDVVLQPASAAA